MGGWRTAPRLKKKNECAETEAFKLTGWLARLEKQTFFKVWEKKKKSKSNAKQGIKTLETQKLHLCGGKKTANAIKSKLVQTGFQRSQGHSFTTTEKLSFDSI